MYWIVEDPTPTLVAAVLAIAALAVALVKTGRGGFMYAIGGVALLTVIILVVEWLVVTDKERIEATLAGAARALERNDAQAVMDYIAPSVAMRGRVAQEMSRVTITRAGFRRVRVDSINLHTHPPTAKVRFVGYIQARDERGEFPYENFIRPFTVELEQHGDRWLLIDYEMDDVPQGRL